MAWYDKLKFWKRRDDAGEEGVTETSADYPIETVEEGPGKPNWTLLGPLVIAALALAVLVGLTGRWAYHHWHHNQPLAPMTTKNIPAQPPQNLKPGSSQGAGSGSGSGSTPANTSPGGLPVTGG